jgi:hypothetical protein
MANSKQTAAKSTGGKPPVKGMAYKAAKDPRGPPPDEEPATSIQLVDNMYEVRRRGSVRESIPKTMAKERLGPEIIDWCNARPGRMLTTKIYKRWRLDLWSPPGTASTPETSNKRKSSEGPDPNNITPKVVRLGADGRYCANTAQMPQKMVPIVFCSLFPLESVADRNRYLDQLESWCLPRRGHGYLLSNLGERPPSDQPLPSSLTSSIRIQHRSGEGGCAPCAVANLLARSDSGQAAIFAGLVDETNPRTIRTWAAWMSANSCWTLQKAAGDPLGPVERIQFLLSQHRGLWVVVPVDDEYEDGHVIGVDMFRRVVLDSVEEYAMPLTMEALQRSLGPDRTLYGIAELRQLFHRSLPSKKRRRK